MTRTADDYAREIKALEKAKAVESAYHEARIEAIDDKLDTLNHEHSRLSDLEDQEAHEIAMASFEKRYGT